MIAALVLLAVPACSSQDSPGPLEDLGHGSVLVITCSQFDGVGRLLGSTWIENQHGSDPLVLREVHLDTEELVLVEADIIRSRDELIWGAGLAIPPAEDDDESRTFWNSVEPLAGAELAPGEGALVVLVVSPQTPGGEGASEGWDLVYRVGTRGYEWHRSEGIAFRDAECGAVA